MPETIQQLELAKSGLEALEILNQQTFDLILMDIDMPVLNGLETARHIRYSKEHAVLSHNRGIPIVAVTTNDTPEWKIQYARVGMVSSFLSFFAVITIELLIVPRVLSCFVLIRMAALANQSHQLH